MCVCVCILCDWLQMYDILLTLEDNETTPTSHDISSEIFKLTKLQFDDNGAVIK